MGKEVDVAGTVAACERSEAAPEGGSGGPLPEIFEILIQGSYSNKEMKFQYIPVYSRMDRTQFPGHFFRHFPSRLP